MITRAWERFKDQARAELQSGLLVPGPRAREKLAPALTVEDVIASAIDSREADFALADALRLPPVIRAKTLLRSIAAQLPTTLYRNGIPAPDQPRIVTRPNSYMTRGEHVAQSVDALVDVGEVFWRLGDYDSDNHPQSAVVLPGDEVEVDWMPKFRGLIPRYRYHGEYLVADRDIKHVAINRRPGELHGRGPLTEGLPYLAPIEAAEMFAAGWFVSGGVPTVVLKHPDKLDDDRSAELKAKWMAAHSSRVPTPAVLSGGVTDSYPDVNPASSQLQEARSYGATVVARLLGIPGPLLLIETSGSTVTYQNATQALGELVKGTLAPTYLSPIELAWSDLVGSRASVRFDLGELQRADVEARFRVYKSGIELGVFGSEEVRTWEGYAPAGTALVNPALRPAPQPAPLSPVFEVPA